jgi:hypothetical protein
MHVPVLPSQLGTWQGLLLGHCEALVQLTSHFPMSHVPGAPMSVHPVPFGAFCNVGTPATHVPVEHMSFGLGVLVSSSIDVAWPDSHRIFWQVPIGCSAGGAGPSAAGVCTQKPFGPHVSVVHGSLSSHCAPLMHGAPPSCSKMPPVESPHPEEAANAAQSRTVNATSEKPIFSLASGRRLRAVIEPSPQAAPHVRGVQG